MRSRAVAVLAIGLAVAAESRCLGAGARRAPIPRLSAGTPLSEQLLAIAKRPPVRNRAEFAVAVAEVGSGEPLLSVNGETPLILASTTKLFTTAAALERLGKDYRFKTRLYADGDVQNGELEGHLVVRGGGDPAISGRLFADDPLAVFEPWARSLHERGLRRIRDGLLLDTSFFDEVLWHPDWPAEQEQHWWQAPVSALSYNDNVILVRATGGFRPGAPALLGFYPAGPPLLSLIGRVFTAPGHGARIGVRRESGSRTVVASGLVGRNRVWMKDVTVPDPPLYFASGFSRVLEETGIELGTGPTVARGKWSLPESRLLHTHETPILPVLAVCNKRSQSFYAEQILKTLGAERTGLGTWEAGRREVAEFLKSLGLAPSNYRLADGSGRSRNNLATANAYLAFLQALAGRWDKFDLYEPTLAITGDPAGSLRHRMLGEATRGRVFAKTGNIAGVVTLCGYVHARSGKRYAFAILINGGCPEGRGHAFQDRFVTHLARFG